MAKNLLPRLLVCTIAFVFASTLASAYSKSYLSENGVLNCDACNAPAPGSFHVTTSGYNSVSLAWNPVWPGASHTIVVLTRNDSTSPWIPVDTIFNVPGASCVVSTLQYQPSKCGFKIATNCTNGEPGDEKSFTSPPIALILELILAGRTPHNPKVILPSCTPLNTVEHNWIGFSVSNGGGFNLIANTFEVVISEDHPVVKRVNMPPLVAGNDNYEYPKNPPNNFINFYGTPPAVFKVFVVNSDNTFTDIGSVKIAITQFGTNKTIAICQDDSQPWNNAFTFKVMVAASASGLSPQQYADRSNTYGNDKEGILVQNVVVENLNVSFPESFSESQQLDLSLWNLTGHLKFKQHYVGILKHVSIPVETLPKGYYFLRIVTEGKNQTFKILKVD